MDHVAFIFPGQGSQAVGMGQALAAASPAAMAVFRAANEALGEDIAGLAWSGPEATLNLTQNAQPALLATSIAYLEALRESWLRDGGSAPVPMFMAGHSMGQYSAMVAAGVISLADGTRLVRERGRLMQASGAGREGAMAALIGLDDAALPELVRQAGAFGIFGVANRNAPGQVVISGERVAIEAGAEIARSLGAKRAIVLPVSVAAHSPLMEEVATAMRQVLGDVPFSDPIVPLLANADATVLATGEACRRELVDHLTAGVDWVRAVESMVDAGVSTFVEIGPGRVLTGLTKRIADQATVHATDDPAAPDRLAVPSPSPGAA